MTGTGQTNNVNIGDDLRGGISFGTPNLNTGGNLGGIGLGSGLDLGFSPTNTSNQGGNNNITVKAVEDSNIEVIFNCSKVRV